MVTNGYVGHNMHSMSLFNLYSFTWFMCWKLWENSKRHNLGKRGVDVAGLEIARLLAGGTVHILTLSWGCHGGRFLVSFLAFWWVIIYMKNRFILEKVSRLLHSFWVGIVEVTLSMSIQGSYVGCVGLKACQLPRSIRPSALNHQTKNLK